MNFVDVPGMTSDESPSPLCSYYVSQGSTDLYQERLTPIIRAAFVLSHIHIHLLMGIRRRTTRYAVDPDIVPACTPVLELCNGLRIRTFYL